MHGTSTMRTDGVISNEVGKKWGRPQALYLLGAFIIIIGGMLESATSGQISRSDKRSISLPSGDLGKQGLKKAPTATFHTCLLASLSLYPPSDGNLAPDCGGASRGILGDCQRRGDKASYVARRHNNAPFKRDKLLVFLTGKDETVRGESVIPTHSKNIIYLAARLGFHAISLSYDNQIGYDICKHLFDPCPTTLHCHIPSVDSIDISAACYAEFRDRVAFGDVGNFLNTIPPHLPSIDPLPNVVTTATSSAVLEIDIDDTVLMRLKDALRGLVIDDPNGGWDAYISNSNIIIWD